MSAPVDKQDTLDACHAIAAAMLTSAEESAEGGVLFRVSLTAPVEATAGLDLGFDLLEWALARWEDFERGEVRYDAYFVLRSDAQAFKALLHECVTSWALDFAWSTRVDEIANENWQEGWKVYFDIIHVSERVVIQPEWIPYTARPDECVITLEPGLSFGTGQHFTTHSCLTLLDRLEQEGHSGALLDVGCGSGILSIGAALLGYGPIVALDNDPQCILTTNENAARNSVSDQLSVQHTAGASLDVDGRFDVVVANILAKTLIALCAPITAAVRETEGARLILAGIMCEQSASVQAAYHDAGFDTIDELRDSEWSTLLLSRVRGA